MTQKPASPPSAMSPAKMAVIGVLALVLVIVLVTQFSGGDGEPIAIKKRTPRASAAAANGSSESPATAAAPLVRLTWPDIPRAEVAAFNPFEVPELFLKPDSTAPAPTAIQVSQVAPPNPSGQSPQSATPANPSPDSVPTDTEAQARIRAQDRKRRLKELKATADALQKQGVAMVLYTPSGAVAKIGDIELHVGDVLSTGLRVKEIGRGGIVFEEHQDDSPPKSEKNHSSE